MPTSIKISSEDEYHHILNYLKSKEIPKFSKISEQKNSNDEIIL